MWCKALLFFSAWCRIRILHHMGQIINGMVIKRGYGKTIW